MAEMKQCPFCGGEAQIAEFGRYSVFCSKQCCEQPVAYPDKETAIEDWNKRTAQGFGEWISVEERLPESLVFVVALTTGGDRIIAQLDKYGWLRFGGYECERMRPITHWMPLPEPPEV